jgi:retron-type reverse transcriptase
LELKLITEDINAHVDLLKRTVDPLLQEEIGEVIESRTNERNALLDKKGKYLAWRAKMKWYNEGEKSNKYFLNLLKRRTEQSEMTSIEIDGSIVTDQESINYEVNEYYKRLYSQNSTMQMDDSFLSNLFELLPNDADRVTSPITLNDLWEELKPLKETAPGPDGISNIFLKKLWDIIGPVILDSWLYSLTIGKLPPSHSSSYLRLIPKAGKNSQQLKNWRPITLSNCDHKLITRVYNRRLIAATGKHVSKVQTAYIKGRNITDNIRMIKAAIQLANHEVQVNGSVVALDAQKAFDSVNHSYLMKVLEKIKLENFNPILKLLYSDLSNETLINGEIKGKHAVQNGVKQGDALSCTLFILAIEPLLRNIQLNNDINPVKSELLQYEWPKCFGYADDITCVVQNNPGSKQGIFSEYEKFTKASGLRLNADKTELYDFNDNGNDRQMLTRVKYLERYYDIVPNDTIKVNGIELCTNLMVLQEINSANLLAKMDSHFQQWSKRHLSLLGKIQIYKTFGLSQFLYHLSVFEPDKNTWKLIYGKINKFLWNKGYQGNQALQQIRSAVLYNDVQKGGFGMLDIKEVLRALRLKRHLTLMHNDVHPMHNLLNILCDDGNLFLDKAVLGVDDVTDLNLLTLSEKRLKDYVSPVWQLEGDLILHNQLLYAKIKTLVRPRKRNGREFRSIVNAGIFNLADAITGPPSWVRKLSMISHKCLNIAIRIIDTLYRGSQLPDQRAHDKLRDVQGRWLDVSELSSKKLRELIGKPKQLCTPKILELEDDLLRNYYMQISKLTSITNKSMILRLLQKDVYCGARLVRFGLEESDRCRRCFEEETINHLLLDCPYSREVLSLLGITDFDIEEILGITLNKHHLEIRCDVIAYLVFKQQILPPKVIVKTTLEKFAKGLVNTGKGKHVASVMLQSGRLS